MALTHFFPYCSFSPGWYSVRTFPLMEYPWCVWPVQTEYWKNGSFKTHTCLSLSSECIRLLGNKLLHTPLHLQVLVRKTSRYFFQMNCWANLSILHFYNHIFGPQLKFYFYPCNIFLPCSWLSFPA